jgi:hypothetical protein
MTTPAGLPRSALLGAWGTAALRGVTNVGDAVRAVQGDDEPHTLVLADDPLVRPCDDLASLLDALRAAGTTGLRLVLPVPGDLTGLAGPAEVNAEAVAVGECLLTVGGAPLALVPIVEGFGSALEPGHLVAWWVHDANLPPEATATLGDVERQLREVLMSATRRLGGLDVADSGLGRDRPELLDRLADVRHGSGPCAQLPSGLPPRSLRVLDLAWRIRMIVELAAEDDGGAVSGWEATRRSEALRELEHAGRLAMVAAVNAGLDAREVVSRSQRWTAS